MSKGITRRDFLNATMIGMGSALLDMAAPVHLFAQTQPWDGYGGIGDYASSHGDTREVVLQAHKIRDRAYDKLPAGVTDTGEIFDLVVIGAGLSGLGAAFYFNKTKRRGRKCLIIENHPVFGGEAKRNEFMVNGYRLIGPQGSNTFVVIDNSAAPGYEIYSELGVPRNFKYQKSNADKALHFDRTNFAFMLWYDNAPNIGYFFEERADNTKTEWLSDIWSRELKETPFSQKMKKDLLTWRNLRTRQYEGEDIGRWLDSMTYKNYIERIMGLDSEITGFVDPVLASSIGLGSDVISAYGAYQVAMPGFQDFPGGFRRKDKEAESGWHSFPGGNDGFVRHFVKALIPAAILGDNTFEEVMNGRIEFGALDRAGNDIRMRLGALAVRVEHNAASEKSEHVWVTYVKDGRIYRLKARAAVMASGSFVSQRIVRDLPAEYRDACATFLHSPFLVVNVGVTNWKFLYKLGITACRWFDGFGFSCNIRQPMIVGDYRPPLDSDKPAILTFYVPFYYPGLSAKEQGIRGRMELLSTTYASYERRIKEQMVRLFGKAGFEPNRDIAGIILNRWGHAYVNPEPGFYFGRQGRRAPREIIRRNFGRIAFAHSELNGHQHWVGAVEEGRRAARQLIKFII